MFKRMLIAAWTVAALAAASASASAEEKSGDLAKMMSGANSEVVVDHMSGKVAKVEAITEGEDLPHAKSQSAAMAKATKSLQAAVDQAEHDNAGAKAVSVTPKLDQGHAVASVKLQLTKGSKTVTVPLE